MLDQTMLVLLDKLRDAFEKGLIVKNEVGSMKALQIAARLRDMLDPDVYILIDKIIAQKLRILTIREAGKSDVGRHYLRSYCIATYIGHSLQ